MAKKRKAGGAPPSRNAFEVLGNKKLRREVAGQKVKGSKRDAALATQKDQQRRSRALLQRGVAQASLGTAFADERFDASSRGGGEERLALQRLRLLAQRQQRENTRRRRSRGFALGDGEDELTHSGVPLAELEDDALQGSAGGALGGALGDIEETLEFPPELFFKEGFQGDDAQEETRPRTRKEIYREIIANSKEAKARLASEQRQQQALLEKLDDDYSDLLRHRDALFRPTKKQALDALLRKHVGTDSAGEKSGDALQAPAARDMKSASKAEATFSASSPLLLDVPASSSSASSASAAASSLSRQMCVADDFDALAASLRFDRRLPGTEKLLTAEEAQERKRKLLEKKERERTERMLQLGDEPVEEEDEEEAEEGEECSDHGEEADDDDEEKECSEDEEEGDEGDEDDENDEDDEDDEDDDEEVQEARTLLEDGSEDEDGSEEEDANEENECADDDPTETGEGEKEEGTDEDEENKDEEEEDKEEEEEDKEEDEEDKEEEEEEDQGEDVQREEAEEAGDRRGVGEQMATEADDEFMTEEEKKAALWMRNEAGEEGLSFQPSAPLTREAARSLLLPHPLKSQWKLLHRVRVLHFGDDAAGTQGMAQKEKKENVFRALLAYALDAHLAALASQRGFPLTELWDALHEHYLFFAEEREDVVFSFFFPLLVNMAARVAPQALPAQLFSLLSSSFSSDAAGDKILKQSGTKRGNAERTGEKALPRDAVHALSVASQDDASLPYPLLSVGESLKESSVVPPTPADLAVLHLLFLLCPLTDFRHPLLSCAFLLLDFFSSFFSSFSLALAAGVRPSLHRLPLPPLPTSEAAAALACSEAQKVRREAPSGSAENREGENRDLPQVHASLSGDRQPAEKRGDKDQVARAHGPIPPCLSPDAVDTCMQILLLQRMAMHASGRVFPSFFTLALALLRTLLEPEGRAEGQKPEKAKEKENSPFTDTDRIKMAQAVLATLRAQTTQMAEASPAAYVPVAHCLLPAAPFLHASILLSVLRSSPKAKQAAHAAARVDESDTTEAVLERLRDSPFFPLLTNFRRFWRESESILKKPLVPLSLYHTAEKVGLTLLTPRYVEPAMLRRRGASSATDDTREDFEELRREKRQANEMRRHVGRMLRRDAAFLVAQKGRKEVHRKRRNADRQKEILGILEQDQVEYKKLKTTGGTMDTSLAAYRPSKCKKKKRMAGNQQEAQIQHG
ncbi:Nop14-like family protein [Toxoplasma gondii ARI]|uniref:Nop14-like family protein n=1 Tax=Toxoplasma gondii ARI TaxID=1074872 RepID=A0A139Y8S0_TOXGO|nr:Nop14-like family protein [Toxoplasma gondii ARI]